MLVYKIGNVLDALDNGDVDIVAHGVNCMGGFGSGIAGEIAIRYPIVRTHYIQQYFGQMGWQLSQIQFIHIDEDPHGKIIANCATQYAYGKSSFCHADYKAISSVMQKLYLKCASEKRVLGIPLIGAGLAGGDWKIIERIISEIFTNYDINVYKLQEEICPTKNLPSSIPACLAHSTTPSSEQKAA